MFLFLFAKLMLESTPVFYRSEIKLFFIHIQHIFINTYIGGTNVAMETNSHWRTDGDRYQIDFVPDGCFPYSFPLALHTSMH